MTGSISVTLTAPVDRLADICRDAVAAAALIGDPRNVALIVGVAQAGHIKVTALGRRTP